MATGHKGTKLSIDVTPFKTIERQLLRAQRMATLGRLASGVMHNLNNEFWQTLFSTRMLEGEQEGAERRRWPEMFRTNVQHSGSTIAQLLSLGKGSDEESTLIRPGDLIEETVAMLRSVLPKPIELQTTLPAGLWAIAGNATDLRHVIMNLCVNALDAMPGGGVLTIEAENYCPDTSERRVLIRITDTGPGMPPEILSRIFDPPFTTKGGNGGTELGLFTAARIIINHRGAIEVSSELGRGTQFKIYLPAEVSGVECPAGEVTKGQRTMSVAATKDIRIVLIDGHELFLAGLRLLIEQEPGFTIVGQALNRIEALEAARVKPDVILLDLALDNENSLDFLPDLMEAAEGARALIVTGIVDPELHLSAVRQGTKGVLLKSEAPTCLFKAIRKVHSGEVWLSRSLIAIAMSEAFGLAAKKPDPEAAKIASLTPRELEVIALIARGRKSRQIAERLFISEKTVAHHLSSLYSKLGVADRLELLIYACQHNLAKIPPAGDPHQRIKAS